MAMFHFFLNYFSFELFFDSVEVYCNEEKTRTFIAIKADIYSSKILANITDKIDGILEDYKLPKFYKVCEYFLIHVIIFIIFKSRF